MTQQQETEQASAHETAREQRRSRECRDARHQQAGGGPRRGDGARQQIRSRARQAGRLESEREVVGTALPPRQPLASADEGEEQALEQGHAEDQSARAPGEHGMGGVARDREGQRGGQESQQMATRIPEEDGSGGPIPREERSEERRVGKEGRAGGSASDERK